MIKRRERSWKGKDRDGLWVSKERVKGCRLLVMFLLSLVSLEVVQGP